MSHLVPQQAYLTPMYHAWKITFLLEEEAFDPDRSQRGDDGRSDDLPRLQVHAVRVDPLPARLQVQQDHLLVHLQGTLDTDTHARITVYVSEFHNFLTMLIKGNDHYKLHVDEC